MRLGTRSKGNAGRWLPLLVLAAVLALQARDARTGEAPNPISFAPPVSYALTGPGDVAASDLDADGFLDLSVATNNAVGVFYGLGDGTFEPAVVLENGTYAYQVAPADLNGDSIQDLVVAGWNGTVVVRLGMGNRTFADPVVYPVSQVSRLFGVSAADFNGDNRPDLAVSVHDAHKLAILLNQGNGTFGAPTVYGAGSYTARIAIADYNGDGKTDLAVSNYVSGNVLLYNGTGTGTFTGGGNYKVGDYPASVVAADLNGDGHMDLATANTFSHNLNVLLNNGQGGFTVSPFYPGNTYPHVMAPVDLDLDGDLDLVTSNNGTVYFSVFQNLGGGILAAPANFPTGGENTRTQAVGDFDRDGRPDVVAACESTSNIWVFLSTTTPAGPVSPANLTAGVVSSTRVDLAWTDRSGNETAFKVERKTGAGFSELVTLGANVTSHSDTTAEANTEYTYRVRAVGATGISQPSNEATVKTFPAAPNAPTGLTAFASAGPRIGLTWADGSLDEDEFEIYRRTEGQPFAFRASVPANTTGYFDNTVAPDTQYYYQVRALNAGGASAFTAEAGARTLPSPPEAPSGLSAAALGPSQVDLSWTDGSTNETGFQIQRRREGQGFSGLATTGPNTSTYADTSAAAGTKYYYRVRAVNTGGSSAYTLEASVTTPTPAGPLPAAPQQLQAVIVSATQVRLEWNDASTNEGGFRVERRIGAGGFVEIGSTPQNVRQYSDTSAAPGEAHVYRVRAFNDAGPSGFSNEAGALIPTGGKLKLSPKKLNFGRVSGPVTRTVRLTNTGRGPLAGTVGSLSAPYSVVSGGGPFQLGAKQSRTVTIRFAPAAAGSFTALLNVTSTDASKAAVGVAVSGKRR